MKIKLSQLKSIIREEVSRSLNEMGAPKKAVPSKGPRPGDVYYGKRKQTPIEINIEVVDRGTVYFTQLMSGRPKAMEMTQAEFDAYLADPMYNFKFDHHEGW